MANLAVKQCNGTYYFKYQKIIQTFDNLSLRLTNKFVYEKLASCSWLYCKDLVGHFGCVNAIEFSNKGGEYLVSGGDDTRVLVWRIGEAIKGGTTPRCLKATHLSNIFCVSFDSENEHIISAGNDDQILRHDFETGELANSLITNDAIYDVCIHPENDNIFITAGEHGVIGLYDLRMPTDQVKLAQGPTTFHSAVYNPVDPAVFVTASSVRGVELWDARVPLRCLKRFDSNAGIQCAMGVAFDQTGQYLAAVRRKLPPVLYHINRNTSLVEFFQEGYYNSCTMKSVCFGGQKDNFIISGSDDFNVYVWDIPMVEKDHEGIAKVEKSFLALNGHRSIVNQVCFNNNTSMLCTAGVEKIIKMWSPFPMTGGEGMSEDSTGEQRTPYSRLDYARMIIDSGRPLAHDYDDQSTSEDQRMIAFFDSLVQIEQDDSSTDSDISSDDDDLEQNSSNIDSLRRIRAIVFEQMRTGELREEDENETQNSDNRNSNDVGDVTEGVAMERLREIITSQQVPTTNTRIRIAELRRDCLNTDEENTHRTSSTVLLKHNQESNSSSNSTENDDVTTDTSESSRDYNFHEQTATESNVCCANEHIFENKSRNEQEVGECSSKSWLVKETFRKHEEKCVSDLSSCSENDFETCDNVCNSKSKENSVASSEDQVQYCDTSQVRNNEPGPSCSKDDHR